MSRMTVRIGGDKSQFSRTIRSVRGEAAGAGKAIASSLMGPLGVGLGVGGLAMGFQRMMSSAIEAGDAVAKGAQKLGTSAEQYQRLDQMAKLAGASISNVQTSMSRMNRVVSDAGHGLATANRSLQGLGLSFEQLDGMKPAERFETIAKRLSDVADEGQRSALAQEIFGRSAVELMPLINNYAELNRQVADMPIMTDSAVKAAEDFNDAMTRMGTSIQTGLINSGMIEYLAKAAEGMESISKDGFFEGVAALFGRHTTSQRRALADAAQPINMTEASRDRARKEGLTEHLTQEQIKHFDEADLRGVREFVELARERAKEAAQAQRDEAAAAAKAAEELAVQEEREKIEAEAIGVYNDILEQMGHQIRQQELINEGKAREAAMEQAVFVAKKRNSDLTDEQIKKIRELAGEQHDLKNITEDIVHDEEEVEDIRRRPDMKDRATELERMGAVIGGGLTTGRTEQIQTEIARLTRESLEVQREIERKTGGDQSIGVA